MHKMTLPDSVIAVARAGAGTNNVPVAQLAARGIPVFNTPGANANAVKELVVAGMFMAARNIGPAWLFARAQQGDDAAIDLAVEKGKKDFVGFELPGRTLGVIGLEVANCALALGMKALGYDPQITVQRAWELSSQVQQSASLDDLFARSDFITVHVPMNDATRGLVNAARLKLMRPGGVLLNFARGGIVDVKAVIESLDSDHLLPHQCAEGSSPRGDPAAPGRLHGRGRGELRSDGSRAAEGFPRERKRA
jgi:D-3-phosphoglycerate dehydrogenase / 2-oxoglutarate reductase